MVKQSMVNHGNFPKSMVKQSMVNHGNFPKSMVNQASFVFVELIHILMLEIYFVDKINLIMYASKNATNSSSLPWYDLVSKKKCMSFCSFSPPPPTILFKVHHYIPRHELSGHLILKRLKVHSLEFPIPSVSGLLHLREKRLLGDSSMYSRSDPKLLLET
jgi:hypothetical protein